MSIKITIDSFIQDKDNWGYVVSNPNKEALIIDPLDAAKNQSILDKRELQLKGILITHYHPDHIAGVDELLKKYSVDVWGPEQNAIAPSFVTQKIKSESPLIISNMILHTHLFPGHSKDLCAYGFSRKLFVGDLVTNLGCGRVIDGDHKTLFNSLQRLKDLPVDTELYVGHDYRKKNLDFASYLDPQYYSTLSVNDLENPTTIEMELWWNPFLRVAHYSDWKQLRDLRDSF